MGQDSVIMVFNLGFYYQKRKYLQNKNMNFALQFSSGMAKRYTQQKEFNEQVYLKLKSKYKNFVLPHTWANSHMYRKECNLTHILRAGLETPNSQISNSPFISNSSSSKRKMIPPNHYKSNKFSTPSSITSTSNAMLSTQFNGNNVIPLFSNDQFNNDSMNSISNKNGMHDEILFNSANSSTSSFQEKHVEPSNISLNESKKSNHNIMYNSDFSVSLKKAFDRTINSSLNVKNVQVFDSNLDNDEPPIPFEHFLEIKNYSSNSISSPLYFQNLTAKEQHYVEETILKSNEVSIALLYSDNSSHLGISNTAQMSNEKITVSAICFSCKTELPRNIELFVPVSASGDNDDKILNFLHKVLTSDILKISFNAYQLYIVCNILLKNHLEHNSLKNIIDLKIASWLLNSDNVPESLCDLENELFTNTTESKSTSSSFISEIFFSLGKLLRLKESIYKRLEDEKLLKLFKYLECPLLSTICQMGQSGICIDKEKFEIIERYLHGRLSHIERDAEKVIGKKISLTSTVQLRQILYDELKLDHKINDSIARTTATKEKSTSEACLLKIADLHPLPRIILNHRRLSKLKSTYIDGLQQYMRFGKLYPSWDQTSAATGRLAAYNPNVQAFPKDSIELHEKSEVSCQYVRDIIVPSRGYQFVSVDFCSIELRILAHFSKDQELIEIFSKSGDVFTTLTSSWKDIPYDSITPAERNRTKRVCYAIIYGVGLPKLSQILDISFSEAKVLMGSFLDRFKNIKRFTNAVINKVRQTKKLRTILNRLRHFCDINHSNFALRKSIERQAVNFVIQGSAADICKVSMLKLSDYLQENIHIDSKLLIQIHDELLYEVRQDNVVEFSDAIFQILESPNLTSEIHLSVPLKVKVQNGQSWGSMNNYC